VPTYEYECTGCRRVFEVKQRISEPALSTCDACGGPVHRLLSAAPFILKGGGWYVTDYPSESRKKALESEKSPSKPTDKPAPATSASAASSAPAGSSSTPAAPSPSSSPSSSATSD